MPFRHLSINQCGIFTMDLIINETRIANDLTPSELVVFLESVEPCLHHVENCFERRIVRGMINSTICVSKRDWRLPDDFYNQTHRLDVQVWLLRKKTRTPKKYTSVGVFASFSTCPYLFFPRITPLFSTSCQR